MRIMITGSNGFIGKALNDLLVIEKENDVICLSRDKDIDFSISGWTKVIDHLEIDTVVHLAQSTRYREFPESALDMVNVNVNATTELLNWSRTHGVKRFLFASSGNVYMPSDKRLSEDDSTMPATFYGATKIAAEHIVKQYSGFFQTVTFRIFAAYGPFQKRMLIPTIIEKIRRSEAIRLACGEGIWMTPIYIDDCVNFMNMLIKGDLEQPYNLFNLAGEEDVSLAMIVSILEEILGKKAKIELTDENPVYFLGSNDKLKSVNTDYQFTTIRQGLGKTLSLK